MEESKPIDLKKEAAGILYRTSQKIWKIKENPGKLVQGVECLRLRLEYGTAKGIFGTDNIPMISSKDPLTAKIIRNAHLVNRHGPGVIHNLAKTTKANLVRGELATFWKGQRRDVDKMIYQCGTFRKFDDRSGRPEMGRSLTRCKIGSSPFQHCSIDPLGPIRVAFPGSGTGKITPLTVCDLNTGGVAIESTVGCKAENISLLSSSSSSGLVQRLY